MTHNNHKKAYLILLIVLSISFIQCNRVDSTFPDTIATNTDLPGIFLNGRQFHAETFGNPANPTVIVVHGGPGWDYQSVLPLAALSDDYFVVFYDQSGCGLSPRYPKEEISLSSSLQDLDAFVNEFNHGQRVNLIGHSFGAMLVSAYIGLHPDKVAYSVLAEPPYLKPSNIDSLYSGPIKNGIISSYPLTNTIETEKQHKKADLAFLLATQSNDFNAEGMVCDASTFTGIPCQRPGALASSKLIEEFYSPEKGYFQDFTIGNNRFKNTILLLFGDCDSHFNPGYQRNIKSSLKKAYIMNVPNAGHFIFTDNPEACNLYIRNYFRNTDMIGSNKTFSF